MLLSVAALLAAACSIGEDTDTASENTADPRREDCVTVDTAVSSEKIELLTELAASFNDSDEALIDGECVFVDVRSKSSGAATTALAEGWDEAADGPRPGHLVAGGQQLGTDPQPATRGRRRGPDRGRGPHAVHAHAAW